MNRGINLLKGLLGMVALAALVLAFNWFFSDARRTPSAGQMPSPTGERPPPVSTHSESVSRPSTSTPAITQPASSPTPTMPASAPARILYARQERDDAPTLWWLDYSPETGVTAGGQIMLSDMGEYPLPVMELSISPDGQHAVLNERGGDENLGAQAWIVDVDTGQATQLPSMPHGGVLFVDWIPGTGRVLTKDVDGASIAISDVDGSNVQQLPYHMFQDGAASPDSRQFVLSSTEEDTFWFMNADGSLIQKVPVPDKLPGGGAPFALSWSPDGQRLAYFDNSTGELSQIRVWNVSTGQLKELSSRDAHNIFPVWSPDGAGLLYLHDPTPGMIGWDSAFMTHWHTALWIADVETEQYRELVPSDGQTCWSPAWLPDGSGAVFVSNRAGQSDIWVVNRDGAGLRPLTMHGDVVALDVAP